MLGYAIGGDRRDVMAAIRPGTIDAIITDPPHGLAFMGRGWDHPDNNVAFQAATWRLAFDVLKPGSHLIAIGAPRTVHRMATAIEDAGGEIRDMLIWISAQGFPHSHNVSKAIDKRLGAKREVIGSDRRWGSNASAGRGGQYANGYQPTIRGAEKFDPVTVPATSEAEDWDGWGTGLKPAMTPIVLARKPFRGNIAENVLRYDVGGLNIDACRVSYEHDAPDPATNPLYRKQHGYANTAAADQDPSSYRVRHEPAERNPHPAGRWPANLLHDGSDEVVSLFPMSKGQQGDVQGNEPSHIGDSGVYGHYGKTGVLFPKRADKGSAARFFNSFELSPDDRFLYYRKARKAEKQGSDHPTIKPLALMRHLVRLITPPVGIVLDPFAGTGTTGEAARLEGFSYVLIEKDPDSLADIERRLRM